MSSHRLILILAGAAAISVIALAGTMAHGPRVIAGFEARAAAALAASGGAGITASFRTPHGWLTRHPQLSGGDPLSPETRRRAAMAVAAIPGIGGVSWRARTGTVSAAQDAASSQPLHCQGDVDAILRSRTLRFSEASAQIDPTSHAMLDEVAAALRPCLGSIIAITGHTDGLGDEAGNLALSRLRAEAVRAALAARGIPEDGLRASGMGSRQPMAGLDPTDPANRRIEFSVIATLPLKPTPVDTPGPG